MFLFFYGIWLLQQSVVQLKFIAFRSFIIQITYLMSRTSKPTPAPPAKAASSTAWKDRLAPEDYQQLQNTFNVFDQDNSGSIDPAEINKVLEQLGLEKRNPFILGLIHGLRDCNRSINFNEFLDIVASRVGQTKTKDGIKRVFAIFDKNGDGSLDFQQFKDISKQLHENLTDDDLLELLHSTHINQKTGNNESVSFQQFYRIVAKFNAK